MSERSKDALILMVKNPVAGKVKTRLAKDLGNEQALEVYQALLQQTAKVASEVPADRFVFYSDVVDRNDLFRQELFRKYTQCGGDLGVRMEYAFSIPFKNEYKRAVIIGADCPDLDAATISEAFSRLDDHDFVLGPAADGGYYLLGMKKWHRWRFAGQPWSQPELLESTRQTIGSHNMTLAELKTLNDIDTLEDLRQSTFSHLS